MEQPDYGFVVFVAIVRPLTSWRASPDRQDLRWTNFVTSPKSFLRCTAPSNCLQNALNSKMPKLKVGNLEIRTMALNGTHSP
ncbi:hypothetical protein T01_8620 [Trichinella spiralis]|uniref:Uncharacterized protein n=1 Tax=Trichinella spiralis TaxID=6334 RepID=A0A0V1BZY5_TRISP|nr:hypothetical protein T01_8620 [Trichinella spiralis]